MHLVRTGSSISLLYDNNMLIPEAVFTYNYYGKKYISSDWILILRRAIQLTSKLDQHTRLSLFFYSGTNQSWKLVGMLTCGLKFTRPLRRIKLTMPLHSLILSWVCHLHRWPMSVASHIWSMLKTAVEDGSHKKISTLQSWSVWKAILSTNLILKRHFRCSW